MKKGFRLNSMKTRIMAVVFAGIAGAILAVSLSVIHLSKNAFVDTYGRSQEQVFQRIEQELNQFHKDLMRITEAVNASWYLKVYLQDTLEDSALASQAAYKMQEEMERAIPSDIENVKILALSKNGGSYLDKEETLAASPERILNSGIAKYAMENPGSISYHFQRQGYTATTSRTPVLMLVRALTSPGSGEAYGVLIVTIKEEDFDDYYEYFTSENSDFYLTDSDGVIVSSSQKEMLNQKMEEEFSDMETVLKKELPDYGFIAYGKISNEKALENLYDVPLLWALCLGILVVSLAVISFLVGQTTKPLSKLVTKMSNARKNRFDEHIVPAGTSEIRELSDTYNTMLDDLNRYIEELMSIQKEKRKAEISALQMQINPHYIYNTLASIKWLIFQGNTEKSTRMIDAFISLLRNTISNSDEYITLEQEIENLKNYVLINNTRYGDQVQVEYFMAFGLEECRVPKMILQPFVENAFFHAFPSGRPGNIQVLVRKIEQNVRIQIIDDGVGMDEEGIRKLSEASGKKEHFSGIGIRNVNDRLKLIYGKEYGIQIESEKELGTTVTVLIPFQ